MPVYVDPLFSTAHLVGAQRRKWPFDEACHMFADTDEALQAMARRLGLRVEWMDLRRPDFPHYDLTMSKRAAAISHGAVVVGREFPGLWVRRKRFERVFTHRGRAMWGGVMLHDGGRAGGQCVCDKCGLTFLQHPLFADLPGWPDGQPYLHRLCDNRLVKL